jgi:transportin-1
LEQWKRLGDFNLYLAVVFSSKELFGTCTLIPVRTVSGLLLKNNLTLMKESSHGEQVQTLYQMALGCLNDENTLIRSTAGSLVSSLVSIFGLDVCPTLFMTLADIVANSSHMNPVVAESALSTFQKICEDSSHDLWMHHAELVNFLIPKLLEWISVLSLSQSHYCITMINQFIIYKPDTLGSHLTEFISILALKASEASKEGVPAQLSELFAKLVCQSLVLLLDAYLHEMTPMLPSIMEYMLSLLSGSNLPVALEACEFWLSLSHHADALNITILEGILPR